MDIKEILKHCDHTLLSVTASTEDIKEIIDDGIKYEVASICLPPYFVKFANEYQIEKYNEKKVKVCTVIGFPNGYNSLESKISESNFAIKDGADELDMVININMLKSKNYEYVENEIKSLADICHENNKILKVIIESCLLTNEEIVKMCEIISCAGADYIKTSTGFSIGGATPEVVKLMLDTIKEKNINIKVKASGGISSLEEAEEYLTLGADRLGTSKVVKLAKEND